MQKRMQTKGQGASFLHPFVHPGCILGKGCASFCIGCASEAHRCASDAHPSASDAHPVCIHRASDAKGCASMAHRPRCKENGSRPKSASIVHPWGLGCILLHPFASTLSELGGCKRMHPKKKGCKRMQKDAPKKEGRMHKGVREHPYASCILSYNPRASIFASYGCKRMQKDAKGGS